VSASAAAAVRTAPLTARADTGADLDPEVLSGYLTARTVKVRLAPRDRESAIGTGSP